MAARVIAVVPARGGSKGIPRKNLRQLGGLPLVSWALRAGLRASHVDRVILSTDDEEIAAIGRSEGADVMYRPQELANDTATTLSVLQDVLAKLDDRPELVVLLEPTSPFRTPEVVDASIRKMDEPMVQSAATVTQLERNPRNIFAVQGDDARRFVEQPDIRFSRRQDFAHLKRINGCVYVFRAANLMAGKMLVDPVKVVEMSAEESVNIDVPLDLALAGVCLEAMGSQGRDFRAILSPAWPK